MGQDILDIQYKDPGGGESLSPGPCRVNPDQLLNLVTIRIQFYLQKNGGQGVKSRYIWINIHKSVLIEEKTELQTKFRAFLEMWRNMIWKFNQTFYISIHVFYKIFSFSLIYKTRYKKGRIGVIYRKYLCHEQFMFFINVVKSLRHIKSTVCEVCIKDTTRWNKFVIKLS